MEENVVKEIEIILRPEKENGWGRRHLTFLHFLNRGLRVSSSEYSKRYSSEGYFQFCFCRSSSLSLMIHGKCQGREVRGREVEGF